MYLHLGNDITVRKRDIICVCDLDNTSQSHLTRAFLAAAEKAGQVVNVAPEELPKSFVVCAEGTVKSGTKISVYLCQLNSSTLSKRSGERYPV